LIVFLPLQRTDMFASINKEVKFPPFFWSVRFLSGLFIGLTAHKRRHDEVETDTDFPKRGQSW
jgi:hypothetical protein